MSASATTATATPAAPPPGATLLAWSTGGAVLAAAVDLLLAVFAALDTAPGQRAVTAPLAAAAYLGLGVAALSWSGSKAGLAAAAAWHVACVTVAWFWFPALLKGGLPPHLQATLVVHGLAAAMAMAGLAAWRPVDAATTRRAVGAAATDVWENFESVLVAVVFALAVRHFAVEAYKIPTESMSPNLLGDSEPHRPGDRVLVEKWSSFAGGPGRFEIWVFRPPLDRSINFVKRVGGLPGETIEIREGDLYVNGKIARKPPRIRDDMWCAVWPSPLPAGDREDMPWSGEGFRRDGADAFRVEGATTRRLLHYGRQVKDGPLHAGGTRPVGDVRIRCDVDGVEPGSRLLVRIVGRAGPVEAALDAAGGGETTVNGRTAPVAGGWTSIRSLEVAFIDLEFLVNVNGTEVARVAADPVRGDARPAYAVAIGVERGGARFSRLRLDRDVHYTDAAKPFVVPEGHYFFLGDNSGVSEDSRAWRGVVIREKATDRRFLSTRPPRQDSEEGFVVFRDRDGVERRYRRGEVETLGGPEPVPFVPREDLHGRAFAVFWPPSWVSRVKDRVRWLP